MKHLKLVAVGALLVAGAAPGLVAPAAAQHRVVTERTVVHDGPGRHGWHGRQVCRWEMRHHHRARVCRTVRYR